MKIQDCNFFLSKAQYFSVGFEFSSSNRFDIYFHFHVNTKKPLKIDMLTSMKNEEHAKITQ